jgi:hypothetical protein
VQDRSNIVGAIPTYSSMKITIQLDQAVSKALMELALANRICLGAQARQLLEQAIMDAKPKRVRVNKYPREPKSMHNI